MTLCSPNRGNVFFFLFFLPCSYDIWGPFCKKNRSGSRLSSSHCNFVSKGVVIFTVGSLRNPMFYVYVFQIFLSYFRKWSGGPVTLTILFENHQMGYILLGDIKDKLRSDDDYVRPSCKAALKPPKRGSGSLSVSVSQDHSSPMLTRAIKVMTTRL